MISVSEIRAAENRLQQLLNEMRGVVNANFINQARLAKALAPKIELEIRRTRALLDYLADNYQQPGSQEQIRIHGREGFKWQVKL